MHSMSISQIRSEFDEFLYAPIDESSNGTLLSVLSALARLDFDPWQEAANLARMPRESATKRLASLILALPGGPLAHLDAGTIAARLIALLPHRGGMNIASHETLPGMRAPNNFHVIMLLIIINVAFLALALSSQYFTANHQPALHAGFTHGLAAKKVVPEVPLPGFDK